MHGLFRMRREPTGMSRANAIAWAQAYFDDGPSAPGVLCFQDRSRACLIISTLR